MKEYEYREVVKILKQNGYKHIRTNGSHEIYRNKELGISCPVKCTAKTIPIGTLKKISRITGIKF